MEALLVAVSRPPFQEKTSQKKSSAKTLGGFYFKKSVYGGTGLHF